MDPAHRMAEKIKVLCEHEFKSESDFSQLELELNDVTEEEFDTIIANHTAKFAARKLKLVMNCDGSIVTFSRLEPELYDRLTHAIDLMSRAADDDDDYAVLETRPIDDELVEIFEYLIPDGYEVREMTRRSTNERQLVLLLIKDD